MDYQECASLCDYRLFSLYAAICFMDDGVHCSVFLHSKYAIRSLCRICVPYMCAVLICLCCIVCIGLCTCCFVCTLGAALCLCVCCCVAPLMCSVCAVSYVGGLRDEDQYLLRHSSPALEEDSPHSHLLAHLDCQDREELQRTLHRLENENR